MRVCGDMKCASRTTQVRRVSSIEHVGKRTGVGIENSTGVNEIHCVARTHWKTPGCAVYFLSLLASSGIAHLNVRFRSLL